MRRIPLLTTLFAMLIVAPADGAIRTASTDDPVGDSPVRLNGERHGDVKRVDVKYDDRAGKITVKFAIDEPFPANYETTVKASISQTESNGRCDYGKRSSDVVIEGYFSYNEYYGDRYSYVSVNGVGILQDVGVGSTNGARDEFTISAQGSALANLNYKCVTSLSQGQPWAADSGRDTVSDVFLVTPSREIPPDVTSFVVNPKAPVLSTTVVRPGDTLTATSRYENRGNATGTMRTATQTIRRPGQPHSRPSIWDGDFTNKLRDVVIPAGGQVTQTGSIVIPANAPAGRWEVYSSWQDANRVYHDSPSGYFTVEAPASSRPNQPIQQQPQPPAGGSPGTDSPSGAPGQDRPSVSPAPYSPAAPGSTPAPSRRFNVDATRSRQSLAGILRSGVRVAGNTPEGGRIVVALYRGNRKIGTGAIVARRSGAYAGRIKLSRAGKRLLRRQPRSIVVEARKSGHGTDASTVRVTR